MKTSLFRLAAVFPLVYTLVLSTQAACTPPPSGILDWWPAEGTVADSAGLNNGLLVGNATFTSGWVGQAFKLDGTNGYVRLPDNLFPFPPGAPAGTPFSFETWFSTTNNGGVILGQESGTPFVSASGWVPAIYVGTDGKLYAQTFWGGSINQLVSTTTVNNGAFHHVAITYDGSTEAAYLDGQLLGSRPFTLTSYAQNYSYQLGVGNSGSWPAGNGTWFPFAGLIDEPALYNRALSSNEVATIFTSGNAGKCPASLPPVIVQQPATFDAPIGTSPTIGVGVNGAAPLTYQWQFNSTNFATTSSSSLAITNILPTQTGAYAVLVSNIYGFAQSATGVVTVTFPIALDTGVSNGVPFTGAGNLESPGAQDVYNFTAPAGGAVYLNVSSAFNRLFWSLTAPDGTAVFTSRYMPNNDIGRLVLPMPGTYRLVVYNDSGITGTYGFSVNTVTDQSFNISIGGTVTNGVPAAGAGNLEVPGAQDAYQFAAASNSVVVFNVNSAFNRLFWSLTAPDGSSVFSGRYMPNNDIGHLQLPMTGTYRLLVYNDSGITGPYSFSLIPDTDQAFNISIGDTVTNGVPSAGAGNLEIPGTWDDYLFTAPANGLVYFDVFSAFYGLRWTLIAPDHSTVFSARYMPYNDVRRVQLPQPGTYRLRVYDDSAQSGTYSFRLTGISDQTIPISIGALVTNNVPAPGAGNLEVPGSYDQYTFTAPTNPVYFTALSAPYRLFWTLYAPNGAAVFNAHYMPYNDIGRVELPMPGTYRLVVYSDVDSTGPYSFSISNVVDQTFNIAIGNTVTNGVPATGAGNLEMPGSYDTYLFTATTNQSVYFDTLAAPYRLFWTLTAPDESVLFSAHYLPYNDVGRIDLPLSGTYQLRVWSDNGGTGPYSFKLWNVTNQYFNIAIGAVVTNGVPTAGAGVLELPGSEDVYAFNANAGQSVHFSDLNSSPRVASWRLLAPGGAQIFSDNLDGGDPGTFTLPITGTYLIQVKNNSDLSPVNYSFALLDNGTNTFTAGAVDQYAINIGDIVSNGVPGSGAGNIETSGARDFYTFTASAGQLVFFQDLGSSPGGQIRYDVYDSDWNYLFGEWLGDGAQSVGRQKLARGGTYHIVASGNGGTTGTYSFKLWPVTNQNFNLTIGNVVSNGVPAAGAGNLETPGTHDVYTFTATPGQIVYFEDRGGNPYRQLRYDVYDSRGVYLFGEWLGGDQEIGRQVLAQGGTYTVIASANADYTGTYSLEIWPVSDQSFNFNVGDIISAGAPATGAGTIESPGVRDIYTFTAAPNQTVYFEDRGSSNYRNIRYDVYDPSGNYLFGEWLGGDQEVGRQTLVTGGTYTVIASGYWNNTGTYSFKIWPVPADQNFTINLGDTISNGLPATGAGNIETAGARDIYTFTASPGQIIYFEDRGSSNYRNLRYDVYDSQGNLLFGEWLGGDQEVGRQVLARGGTYTLVASGYWNNTGTYQIKLWPVSDQSFSFNIGDVVTNGSPAAGAGNIESPGVRDLYTFTASPAQLVFFEDRNASSPGNLRYDVYDQNWNYVFGEWLNGYNDLGLRRLTLGGTYHLTASGNWNTTGTYSFRVWDALPRILEQPLSVHGVVGQPQTLSVRAENPFPLFYQWQFYGTNLPGAVNPILNLPNPMLGQSGPYDVIVSNAYGSVTSVVATLTLDAAEFYVTAFSPSGPVATNVSQLSVQFNSPVLAASFTPADVAITGPSGPLNNNAFTVSQVNSQMFTINLPAQSAEGVYTVSIGPAITNLSGTPMSAGALSPVYSTDFENGADGAWSSGLTLSSAISTRFLGEFSNDYVTLLLAGLPPHGQLRVMWDSMIIDTWDGNLNPGPDYFGLNVTGQPQPTWEYTFHESGNPLLQTYPFWPDISGVNYANLSNPDSIYRNLRLDVPHTNDTMEVTFYGRDLQGVNDEGWGIDNVRVLTPAAADGTFTARFVIDKTAPTVTGISPNGTNLLPVSSLVVSFSEPIQPQTLTTIATRLTDPLNNVIPMSTPTRLNATNFQFTFPSQRYNGTYTLVISNSVLDLAGNALASSATNTFNILTPPTIATQPQSQTIVRNNTVTFTVAANATPPVQYQWTYNGAPLSNATNSTLTLVNVQTNQSGNYAVTVTDVGGSTPSAPATLTVLPTYGPFVAQAEAARSTVPAVPGNGVYIELYNSVGGNSVPTPDTILGHVPDGTTLSAFIQFPNPGPTIDLGNTFDSFFATTTTPPDQLRGLQTANFTMRLQFYLAVTRSLDQHPETPEIDLQLGVGSDDGFYLQVGTNFLGSAGPRGFTYTWMNVSFQDEGLYPITLYYDDNGVGPLGLQFAWQTATNAAQIIPQSALYIAPDLGDRLITFEEVPVGSVLTNQYIGTGVVFTTVSGTVQVTTNFPGRFVPVSPVQVLADPNANPSQPDVVDITFVAADRVSPATSDFVSFFLINGQNDVPTVAAYGTGGNLLYTNSFHAGGASQQLVSINAKGIARVRINLGQGTNAAAIDNLAFLTPVSLPDLVVTSFQAPTNVIAGQPVQLVWQVANQGFSPAQGPWTDTIGLSTDGTTANAQPIASVTYSNYLVPGASLVVTQTVIMPSTQIGDRWFVVTVNSGHAFQESGSLTNNTAIAPFISHILAPDLVVNSVTAPASAQLGQTINVSWILANSGNTPANAPWNDRVWLSTSSNGLVNATALLTAPALSALAPGGNYTNSQPVTLPVVGSLNPGNYFLFVQADADGSVIESSEANNLLGVPLTLTVPPLPDLVAGNCTTPSQASAGQTIPISWSVTNIGAATASGAWRETVYLVPAALPLAQFATNAAAYPLVGAFEFTNTLVAGASVTRTQQVTIPLTGASGDLRAAVLVDSDNVVPEQNEANNAALAVNDVLVPAALSLTLPTTNVLENTSSPNLTCLVARNGNLTAPLVVSLASSATNHLVVPASVTIAAGTASATFTATVLDDGVFDADAWVAISAQAGGYIGSTSQVLVVNTDLPRLALALAASQITESQTVNATVFSDTPMNQPVVVNITSSNPSRLNAPTSVTIPANSNSAPFVLFAVPNTTIDPTYVYNVSASAAGFVSALTNLTVFDNNAPTLALALDRTNVSEGDGPLAAIGTITRTPVTDQPVTVALASSNTAAALVPATATIPALQSQVSFYVAVVGTNAVTGQRLSLLSAQALDVTGSPAGAAATELFFVQDTNGPSLTVTIANKVVGKGLNPATTATVSRNTPATNDLFVTLSSSATSEAVVPASIVISNGQSSAAFAIASLNDGTPGTSQTVAITAGATNFASGGDVLTVTDLGLPDLLISSITVPASAFTGEPLSLSFRLLNQGLGSLTNPVTQNIYLSTDPSSGNYLLVGSAPFGGPLAAGQFTDQLVFVPGAFVPQPGTYWVLVAADAGNTVNELNELNNLAVSRTPLVITAEYTATVQAGVTNVVAGTPVPLSGTATLVAGGPAANKPVNILLTVRGLTRTLSVTTDANGNFSTVFTPLPNEAGFYTVAAVAPGITNAPAQAQFTIVGAALNPSPLTVTVTEGSNISVPVSLQNLSEVPISGLTASLSGVAANLSASATFSTNYLAGQGAVTLNVVVAASDSSIRQSAFTVQLTSNEGVTLSLPVNVAVTPLVAQLSTAPARLSASMLRGAQTILQFEVVNLGGAASGPLTVSPPAVPWFSVASTNPLPSLNPGQSNMVTLVLTPDANLALGPYTGALTVSGSGLGLTVPFTFNCVSDAHGGVRVHSVDEFTFFAAGSPPLTNAFVTLIEPFSRSIMATGLTDTAGQLLLTNVMEGIYELDVTADQHASFKGSATVTAAKTNDVETFLSRQTVTYTWTVVPTNIQDVTHITVQTTFEANVPAPVIVPTPASIDVGPLQQPGQFMDVPITLANYGLIAVDNVALNYNSGPDYQFNVLTPNIGRLSAHASVTVPMRITRVGSPSNPARSSVPTPSGGGSPCISVTIAWTYPCGGYNVGQAVPVAIFNAVGNCGGPGGGGTFTVTGGAGGGGTVVIPPGQVSPSPCDPCGLQRAIAILKCIIKFIPFPDWYKCADSTYKCATGNPNSGKTAYDCFKAEINCLKAAGASIPWSKYLKFPECAYDIITACQGLPSPAGGNSPSPLPPPPGGGGITLGPGDGAVVPLYQSALQLDAFTAPMVYLLGDPIWLLDDSSTNLSTWLNAFVADIDTNSPSGEFISPDEGSALLALPLPLGVTTTNAQQFIGRWNLTVSNWNAGILNLADVPVGQSTNFIALDQWSLLASNALAAEATVNAGGFADPAQAVYYQMQALQTTLSRGGGTCAHVVLQLNQDAVLTRDAFSATLQLDNNGASPLQNVSVNLVVQNTAGQDVTSLFGIQSPLLAGSLSGVNGGGALQPNSTGSAQWTLIPTLDAAPQAPTNYLVSGTLSYTLNGVVVTIPLAPAPITVQPSPQLHVKYFHQRDVFADDPYTPAIEPSIPYSLGVLVQNQGYGVAHDFKITSAQPKIVDNQKGLLIDFKIIGAQVGSQPVAPTLTVDFGDLAPGSTSVGRWLLTSTLQGLFINYSATFQHVDPLGNPRLSLIQGVEIHEMNHLVHADRAWDDGLPDFLVNDIPDFNNLPDTLYQSDGSVQPVNVVQSATPDAPASSGHLQVQLTANFPAGFSYVQVPDPANGQFQLIGVTRANGTNFLAENFWTTDRTFIGLGQPPIHENILHLFDYHTNAGPDTYTLVYAAPSTVPQTNPPVSAVFALPAHSPATFGVVWSGANFVGQASLAYYDIFVSDNSAPFTVWQARTTSTGGLYNGLPGHTYAFYSVATDTAGNVEAPPATPDSMTTVTLSNTPPTIAFATNLVVIDEGTTLSITPTVSDTDLPPEVFSFALGAGTPAGVTVNPATGRVTWPTTELDGPGTNTISVIVTDNGFPPLSATGAVTVVVNEVNSAPILSPIPNYTINEGFKLSVTNVAVDYDIPTNILTFSLSGAVPAGAGINAATGLFTWRPSNTQGPSTNLFTVVVTDNGIPPLSATQTFTVIVRDTLSDFTLSVGSTNLLAGESSSVPLVLSASLQLTNINLQLTAPGQWLTNLGLRLLSGEVSGVNLSPLGADTYVLNFNLNPALQTASVRPVATLDFLTRSNYHSAIVPLGATSLLAQDLAGNLITNGTATSGRVIVIGREPILDIKNVPPPQITLYGRPGAIYSLLANSNLLGGVWSEFARLPQTNRSVWITPANISAPQTFYRALEFKAEPPTLSIRPLSGSLYNLQLSGWPGVLYGLETTPQLGVGALWTPLTQFTLTNTSQNIPWTNTGGPSRFFRGTVP